MGIREYETVYILQPQLADSQISQMNSKLEDIMGKFNGCLFYAKSMGKRNLAYPIKKQSKGIYQLLCYAAEGTCVSEIERALMLDENILRYLTVQKTDKIDVERRAAEIEATGEGLEKPPEVAPVEPCKEIENGDSISEENSELEA